MSDIKRNPGTQIEQPAAVNDTAPCALDDIFCNLVLQSPISTWIADKNGTNIFENDACRQLLGIESHDEVVGKYNIFDDEVLKSRGLIPTIRRVFEEGIPAEIYVDYDFSKVKHVKVPQATHKYLRGFFFPIRDQAGNVQYVVVQHEDYTDRHEAEMALREEKSKAQMYLDIVGALVVVIGADQRVSLINKRGCEILGYDEHEIVGRNWFDHFIPERLTDRLKTVFDKVMAGESDGVERYENPVKTRSGEERIIAWHNTILTDSAGQITGTLSSGEDITEHKRAAEALKRSEERYRSIFENSALGIFQATPRGRLIAANASLARMLGYDSPDELMSTVMDIAKDLYVYPERRPEIVKAVLSREETSRFENHLKHKDGRVIIVNLYVKAVRDETGRPMYLEEFVEDITESRMAEQRRLEMEASQRDFYRRSLFAATDGKLVITEYAEIERLEGPALGEWDIETSADLRSARHGVSDLAEAHGMEPSRMYDLMLCVGEAGTNALKHAGRGVVSLHEIPQGLLLVIKDHGHGIETLALPEATLLKGYSTAGSLGMGYKAILHVANKVYLATGPSGTTVAVQMDVSPQPSSVSVESLPDTW